MYVIEGRCTIFFWYIEKDINQTNVNNKKHDQLNGHITNAKSNAYVWNCDGINILPKDETTNMETNTNLEIEPMNINDHRTIDFFIFWIEFCSLTRR